MFSSSHEIWLCFSGMKPYNLNPPLHLFIYLLFELILVNLCQINCNFCYLFIQRGFMMTYSRLQRAKVKKLHKNPALWSFHCTSSFTIFLSQNLGVICVPYSFKFLIQLISKSGILTCRYCLFLPLTHPLVRLSWQHIFLLIQVSLSFVSHHSTLSYKFPVFEYVISLF